GPGQRGHGLVALPEVALEPALAGRQLVVERGRGPVDAIERHGERLAGRVQLRRAADREERLELALGAGAGGVLVAAVAHDEGEGAVLDPGLRRRLVVVERD